MSDQTDTEDDDIKLHSEGVNEILSHPPKWIIRGGTGIVFLFILIALALSKIIRYPETISAQVTLTTINPTANIVAKNNGKITRLFVSNNQVVKKEQAIAVIENTANYNDVCLIDSIASGLHDQVIASDTMALNKLLAQQLNLGTITPDYLQFMQSYKDYRFYYATNLPQQEMSSLQNERSNYIELLRRYKTQDTLYSSELNLSEKEYQRNEKLFNSNVIASKDFEDQKKSYIEAKRNFETQGINISNAQIAIATINNSITQLQIQQYNQVNKLEQDLKQKLLAIENTLSDWKQNYLLQSPIDGKITFTNFWSINQYIKSGEAVFSVVPLTEKKIIAKLVLPASNSGKVKVGEKVHIKLDDYPYMEYGMLNGTIKNISLVPNNNNYILDAALNNGMKTSYNKTLDFKPEMQGQANIITKNYSMLDRIFFQFKQLTAK